MMEHTAPESYTWSGKGGRGTLLAIQMNRISSGDEYEDVTVKLPSRPSIYLNVYSMGLSCLSKKILKKY